ncbi:MAG TPA: hypothetical protein VN371_06235 [Chlorobaculum sp.]|nr:hypothetical protein [Chlorobaculum sp.]
MNKNGTLGVLVALVMSGVFGGVGFAADKAVDAKPAVKTEEKAAPAAEKKATKKKAAKKKAVKKVEAASPEAGK